jgi:hypothetical protein
LKLKIVLLAIAGILVLSATAEAYYVIPFGKARRYSKEFVLEECNATGPNCKSWKVGHCRRISPQRVDCAAGIRLSDGVCTFVVENRVGVYGSGRVHQRRRGLRCKHF